MGSQWLSTIWVGLPSIEYDLGILTGKFVCKPLIFETMRFRVEEDRRKKVLSFPDPETGEMITQARYASEEEAYQAHLAILKKIRETEMI